MADGRFGRQPTTLTAKNVPTSGELHQLALPQAGPCVSARATALLHPSTTTAAGAPRSKARTAGLPAFRAASCSGASVPFRPASRRSAARCAVRFAVDGRACVR